MGLFSKLAKSTDLMQGMADRLGVDLSEAICNSPDTEAAKYRGAVIRCSCCADQGACAELQAQNDRLAEAPDYCMNREMMAAHQAES
ncbi:adenylosuccinate lyase [Ruegeria sediminis]|uniref:Adenylosuccinate lyase n=1 Tax=Ruegeria sediminis TaxID=2583820 RepID=A0ABY2WVR7_9RHOB|nr:DUF6455 family protein [Ruegeria sediminis]TMV06382.1 adenylosuccinate lyase [Ruegeria sediminis]